MVFVRVGSVFVDLRLNGMFGFECWGLAVRDE